MTNFGVFIPNLGPFADARVLADLGALAESSGWDGFFVWDHILFSADSHLDVVDPWVALTAVGLATQRIRLGALMTPLSRRRPWKVARETASIDRLTGGRLVFGASLGFPPDAEFEFFGEASDPLVRAQLLDEALDVVTGLWKGDFFSYAGRHFSLERVRFTPPPVQHPRIPVWVAGWWPNQPPFRRAARWDGVVPELVGGAQPTLDDVQQISAFVAGRRESSAPFDIVLNGYDVSLRTDLDDFAAAGVTWWLERVDLDRAFSVEEASRLIRRGPGGG